MLNPRFLGILSVVLGLAAGGCGPSVRESTIGWAAPHDGAGPEGVMSRAAEVPAEYIWTGGAQIVGSSLRSDGARGLVLNGRVTAASPSFLSSAHVVRVEVFDRAGRVIWSGVAPVEPDHHVRLSRDRCGTFQLKMPALRELDHIHAGVVDVQDSDRPLPATCLAARP